LSFPRTARTAFTIKHYAGEVTYEAIGMRDKNRDALHPDLAHLMAHGSRESFVRSLFGDAGAPSSPAERGRRAADRKSVASQFLQQLGSLMRSLEATTTHYCRCIKPNRAGVPREFESAYVAGQLRSAGVLEAVRIARLAYPTRVPLRAFLARFKVLEGDTAAPAAPAARGQEAPAANDEASIKAAVGALLHLLLGSRPAAAAHREQPPSDAPARPSTPPMRARTLWGERRSSSAQASSRSLNVAWRAPSGSARRRCRRPSGGCSRRGRIQSSAARRSACRRCAGGGLRTVAFSGSGTRRCACSWRGEARARAGSSLGR
jgi:hypothetical protein